MDIFFWGMPKQGFRVTLISLVVAFSTAFFGTAIVSRLIGEIMQTMEPAPVKNNPIQ